MRTVNFKQYTVNNPKCGKYRKYLGGRGLYMTPLERKFRGAGGSNQNNHPWVGYGYFLESHSILYVSSE